MQKNNSPVPSGESPSDRLFTKRMLALRLVVRAPEHILDTILALLHSRDIKNSS